MQDLDGKVLLVGVSIVVAVACIGTSIIVAVTDVGVLDIPMVNVMLVSCLPCMEKEGAGFLNPVPLENVGKPKSVMYLGSASIFDKTLVFFLHVGHVLLLSSHVPMHAAWYSVLHPQSVVTGEAIPDMHIRQEEMSMSSSSSLS